MRTAEFIFVLSIIVVVAVVLFGALNGWVIAIVPGVTYVIATGVAYLLYRQFVKERASTVDGVSIQTEVFVGQPEQVAHVPALAEAVSFRIVGAKGACPLGHKPGQIVTLSQEGHVSPQLCPAAEATLRIAATDGKGQEVKDWCCPIYDHMLVFRRQAQAA